jgi:hypothetical protein
MVGRNGRVPAREGARRKDHARCAGRQWEGRQRRHRARRWITWNAGARRMATCDGTPIQQSGCSRMRRTTSTARRSSCSAYGRYDRAVHHTLSGDVIRPAHPPRWGTVGAGTALGKGSTRLSHLMRVDLAWGLSKMELRHSIMTTERGRDDRVLAMSPAWSVKPKEDVVRGAG